MTLIGLIWPLFFPVLGALIALVHIYLKHYRGLRALETVLVWQLAAGVGLSYLYGGLGHLFFADQVAASIGWPTGNPFQREVGMWDLSMGILGILCLKFRNEGFFTATVIGTGIFSIGAGLGHVYEMFAHGDFAPDNAGPVLYMDIFYPVILVILLILYHQRIKAEMRPDYVHS
jgi:hypothetical protein